LIRHMRTVVVAGIDMVHASFNGLAQNLEGADNIARWSPHLWTRQLHRAITHAVHGQRSVWECQAAAEIGLFGHSVSPCFWSRCAFVPALERAVEDFVCEPQHLIYCRSG